jgi:hypothetical protein
VQAGVAIFLLHYGLRIYKKQKIYDKSSAKVNERIEKAQEAIPALSRVSNFVLSLIQAKDDKDFLEKFFRRSEVRREIYITSFLNGVLNLSEETKRQNEIMAKISKVKDDNLIKILFELSSERYGLIFRFDDYFKMLRSRTENTPELLNDWLSLRNAEMQFNQKTEDFSLTLAEAHDENEERTVFEKRLKDYCQRNNFKFFSTM